MVHGWVAVSMAFGYPYVIIAEYILYEAPGAVSYSGVLISHPVWYLGLSRVNSVRADGWGITLGDCRTLLGECQEAWSCGVEWRCLVLWLDSFGSCICLFFVLIPGRQTHGN